MTISFLCPNGHQLSAKKDRAGKPGQCPTCGSKFVVPESEEATSDDEAEAPEPTGEPDKEDNIVFLCPNGHRLNGPASLQGRPGQCPHCGAKFRIPTYEDEPEQDSTDNEEVVELVEDAQIEAIEEVPEFPLEPAQPPADLSVENEIPVGTIVDDADVVGDDVEILEEIEEIHPHNGVPDLAVAETVPASADGIHPLAGIILKIWPNGDGGLVVELHLREGEVVCPYRMSTELSRGDYGVFAIKEDDGTFTVMTIPWDAVCRVGLRKLKKLPEELFDRS